jgi:hypothetical protein
MPNLARTLEAFRRQDPPKSTDGNPFQTNSTLAGPASRQEIAQAWGERRLDPSLVEFWTHARDAQLFVDIDFGQWGLKLLSPDASRARTTNLIDLRPHDVESTDVVIGEFIGDLDLLVIPENGSVVVALPLDPRADWYTVAPDLATFLDDYWANGGDKYWERHG